MQVTVLRPTVRAMVSAGTAPTAPNAPLRGLRVLETAAGVAGPYAGRLLALMGADVVKVEPAGGDPSRRQPVDHRPLPGGAPSPLFVHLNVAKRLVGADSVDLTAACAWADVVIDHHVLSEVEGTPLAPTSLRSMSRPPVMVRLTAWGAHHNEAGTIDDELAVQAASGVMSVTAAQYGRPIRFPGWQSQYLAGGYGVAAALVAIADGSHEVDVAWADAMATAVEAGLATLLYDASLKVAPGVEVPKPRAIQDGAFPSGPFRCADGFVVPGTVRPLDWQLQCELYERPDLLSDERFSWRERWQHRDELRAEIQPWYDAHTRSEIFEAALAKGWAAAMVLTGLDALDDPHLRARSFLRPVKSNGGGDPDGRAPAMVVADLPWRTPARDAGEPVALHTGGGVTGDGVTGDGVNDDGATGGPQLHLPARSGDDAVPRPPTLADVRVLELTWAWAGPFVGRLLGAAGADVVRVETGSRPDGWRTPIRWRHTGLPIPEGVDPESRTHDAAALFNSVNRNKRAVSVDLRTGGGKEAFGRLLDAADVFVVNMTASVLDDRGIADMVDAAVGRGLVAITLPALGASGPFRAMPGYGTLTEGMGGFGARFGPAGDGAGISNTYYPDCVAGLHATVAVLAGLAHRNATGDGSFFDFSQQEAMWGQLGEGIVVASTEGRDVERLGNADPGRPSTGVRDDDAGGRVVVADRQSDAATVVDLRAAYLDGSLTARGVVEMTEHPVAGTRAQLALPVIIDGTRLTTARPAPLFDQHTDEVLISWAGADVEEVQRWRAAQAVGTTPGRSR